jgi:hypothetical protein
MVTTNQTASGLKELLFEKSIYSDVTICFDGVELRLHRYILMEYCEYFRALFEWSLVDTIELPFKRKPGIQTFKHIYGYQFLETEFDDTYQFYHYCKFLSMDNLPNIQYFKTMESEIEVSSDTTIQIFGSDFLKHISFLKNLEQKIVNITLTLPKPKIDFFTKEYNQNDFEQKLLYSLNKVTGNKFDDSGKHFNIFFVCGSEWDERINIHLTKANHLEVLESMVPEELLDF